MRCGVSEGQVKKNVGRDYHKYVFSGPVVFPVIFLSSDPLNDY